MSAGAAGCNVLAVLVQAGESWRMKALVAGADIDPVEDSRDSTGTQSRGPVAGHQAH